MSLDQRWQGTVAGTMGELAGRYLDTVTALLRRIREEELPQVERAADLLAETIAGGRRVFAFGCSHSSLAVQDLVYRAGGLMLINPIFAPGVTGISVRPATLSSALEKLPGLAKAVLDHSPVRPGDALIVISVSGRNAVPVEMATLARERGATVIGVTSSAYADDPASRLRHGCDLVLDCKVSKGDAELELTGVPQRFCSASTIALSALLQSTVAATVEKLVARGITPPIFMSGNVEGGPEWNARLLEQHRDRVFYL